MPAARTAVRPERRSPVGGTSVAAARSPTAATRSISATTTNWNIGPEANNFSTEVEQFSGTKVYGFPVVLSALFDAAGVLVGTRIVSDPRDPSRRREEAYALRNFITARFGRDGWDCIDHPPADGETPVIRTFVKQDCRKTIDGVGVATLQTRYLRKKGQSQYDPRTDRETEGQFESYVRFELTK